MKVKKDFVIPEHTETRTIEILCDLCKRGTQESVGSYRVDDVTIERRFGYSYPDGSSGQTVSFDICGECFEKKLQPFLASHGAAPEIEDFDY